MSRGGVFRASIKPTLVVRSDQIAVGTRPVPKVP